MLTHEELKKLALSDDEVRQEYELRWSKAGTGKRGGVRVIYFNLLQNGQILVLDLYEKSEKEDLTTEEKKKLERLKDE